MTDSEPDVFSVWHAHEIDGAKFTRLLGVYSTETLATTVVLDASLLPGFCDTAEGFVVESVRLGERQWTAGFSPEVQNQ